MGKVINVQMDEDFYNEIIQGGGSGESIKNMGNVINVQMDEDFYNKVIANSGGSGSGGSKYEFVDLGLPSGTLWTTTNVGATKPEESGLYFAWGETEGYTAEDVAASKKVFSLDNYKFYNESSWLKYNNDDALGNVDNLNILELVDDAAYQNDKTCRMPTQDDFEELLNNTTASREVVNNINGWRFTSKINNNSIFIPGAGYYINSDIYEYNNRVSIWASSLDESNPRQGWQLDGAAREIYTYYCDRTWGMPIRPVQNK